MKTTQQYIGTMLSICSSLLYIAVIEHHNQKQVGVEGVYLAYNSMSWPTILCHSHLLKEVIQELKAETRRQELKQKPWLDVVYCLVLMGCSDCFFIAPRTTCSGVR